MFTYANIFAFMFIVYGAIFSCGAMIRMQE